MGADIDYTKAWQNWESLWARRKKNPVDAMKEYLRSEGWIVERPETLSLPVKVARSGSFNEADGYRITLHTRVNIGDRLAQCDVAIDWQHAENLPSRAFTGSVSEKFRRMIMDELEPTIQSGFEREINRAKAEAND